MTITEFSEQFDVLFNNITSNQAPGLNEYEKSVYLTKAEKEIVKNYFSSNSKGNTLGQGFDDSAKRQADFSVLMKTAVCTRLSESGGNTYKYGYKYTPTGGADINLDASTVTFTKDDEPYTVSAGTYTVTAGGHITIGSDTIVFKVNGIAQGAGSLVVTSIAIGATTKIDDRSLMYAFPSDTFIVINESVKVGNQRKQVMPLRYDEYSRLMMKPYKRPLKNQVWRLMNSGISGSDGHSSTKIVELICGPEVDMSSQVPYAIRYVRIPAPIIVGNLDGLTIDGISAVSSECELDPILHEDVLQRAVELAKIAWTSTGQDNAQLELQSGIRSE
jgi:hypothetical protein